MGHGSVMGKVWRCGDVIFEFELFIYLGAPAGAYIYRKNKRQGLMTLRGVSALCPGWGREYELIVFKSETFVEKYFSCF